MRGSTKFRSWNGRRMSAEVNPSVNEPTRVSFPRFVGYFLWLGTVGFGGPIALAGHMQQDLVDERGWISKEDYLEGLALAQLAPGPLAAQLAIYLGYIRAGVLGATAVGVAFVLPSFLMVLALSAAYIRFGGLPWMQGMFYGIGAAVIGIITRSAFKLTKLTLGKDKLLWGMFVFGSGLAVVPFLYGGVVQGHHWLTDHQFVDAVAVAMITPGPVVITVAFIGFIVAGVPGATAAALGIFLPVYLVVVLLAPSYKRWAKNPQLNAFVRGVTAAATGAIAGAVIVLARRSIYDLPTFAIAIVSLGVLFRWKVPEPIVIGCAAMAGLLLRPA